MSTIRNNPTLTELIKMYEAGELKEGESYIFYYSDGRTKGWTPYSEVKAMSELNNILKKEEKDFWWNNNIKNV